MLHDVFVSYAREDRQRIEPFVAFMRQRNLNVWFDDRIAAGDRAFDEIATALRDSSFVLLFWSAGAAGSSFVQREVRYADTLGKRIVPIKLDRKGYPGAIALLLADRQAVDARNHFPEREMSTICDRIEPRPSQPAPIIATLNMKGGVGKTTLSANLSAAFHAAFDKNVLMIDLDPQANLSNLLVDPERYEERLACDQAVISCFEPSICTGAPSPTQDLRSVNPIVGAPPEGTQLAFNLRDPLQSKRLDVIIGQFELFKYSLPANFPYLPGCKAYFEHFIGTARSQYDLIVIDAAPSNSFITECAVRAATDIVAPVTADKYALRGLSALKRLIEHAYQLPAHPRLHVLRNAVGPELTDAEQPIVDEYTAQLLDARIPKSEYFAIKNPNAAVRVRDTLSTLAFYRGQTRVKAAVKKACTEILERIERA
ncbi:MAG: AAA family ATPase [Hyphomonadaceae bacterium]|nr:AAA family ATPase [Hyphomonadaceae bacterium]